MCTGNLANFLPSNEKVLSIVLPWGNGHFTRSLPVINNLIELKNTIFFLSSFNGIIRWRDKLPPEVITIAIEEAFPNVKYSSVKFKVTLSILYNAFKLLALMKIYRKTIKNFVIREGIRYLISDGVIGFGRCAPNQILINHQFYGIISRKIRIKYPEWLFSDFDKILIPDFEEGPTLSGKLSHPLKISIPFHYIGALSRFASFIKKSKESSKFQIISEPSHVVWMISGPPPTPHLILNFIVKNIPFLPCRNMDVFTSLSPVLLANELSKHALNIEKQIREQPYHFVIETLIGEKSVKFHSNPPDDVIYDAFLNCGCIISTSGYSSIMDIAFFPKARVIIPTPGQFEQEYLAGHLESNKFAKCLILRNFDQKLSLNEWNHIIQEAKQLSQWHLTA